MITFVYEWIVALTKGWGSGDREAFLILVSGLWVLWMYVFIATRFYKPWGARFNGTVSVIVPVYKEDWNTFLAVMASITDSRYPIAEILVIGDAREPQFVRMCEQHWAADRLIRVLEAPAGKRAAIRMGVEAAKSEIVVVIESDTFAGPESIGELLRPFADLLIGGVVGKQLVYEPHSITAVLNNWAEAIKYAFIIPFQSMTRSVTVLGGRCVAYRRAAVLPLMEGLTTEKFLGFPCQAGDDGRLTSLLMATGWGAVYQSTADFRTISPETYFGLLMQRLRWFRNSCRRTLRAFFCIPEKNVQGADRFWVYKRPRALYQMVRTWLGSVIMIMLWYLFIKSVWMGYYFHWFGTTPVWAIVLRILVISILGAMITRVIKSYPIFKTNSRWWLLALPLFPLHMSIVMVALRLIAIPTMWQSGWLSRKFSGKGGFQN